MHPCGVWLIVLLCRLMGDDDVFHITKTSENTRHKTQADSTGVPAYVKTFYVFPFLAKSNSVLDRTSILSIKRCADALFVDSNVASPI